MSDLDRFVVAQEADGTYDRALAELRAGRKTSHWMWFVLPQLRGLGRSATAQHFGLADRAEATAYAAHPVLGPRLQECASALLGLGEVSAESVLGSVDALKLRSSMTLFLRVDPGHEVWAEVLDRFFDGEPDPATDALLS